MNLFKSDHSKLSGVRTQPRRAALLGFAALAALGSRPSIAAEAGWQTTGALTVRGSYDGNVFLQESGALSGRDSLITTICPEFGASFVGRGGKGFAAYAPEVAWYRDEREEDFVAHRLHHAADGVLGTYSFAFNGSLTVMDGPGESVVYDGVGGAPAVGGFSTRDRRDATVVREHLVFARRGETWVGRAVFGYYDHDFRSNKRALPGYQNHADREDRSWGADLGRRLSDRSTSYVGFRSGSWRHERLFGTGPAYDHDYVRALVSIEGDVAPKVKLTAATGPTWHDYGPHTAQGFRARTTWYMDIKGTYAPTSADALVISVKQFLQPSGSGGGISEDTIATIDWTHVLSKRWVATIGLRAYWCDFESPVVRSDLIKSLSLGLRRSLSERVKVEAGITWDDGDSRVRLTPAREFQRFIGSVSMRTELW
ncbi:hypothetical protein ASA1KI_33300 [Opitutales bacterium ASA1]|uniref:hypothetical protein n=1 Tax=Congregicoccus parvus TaxID=3081749 RepID=UPI002B2C6E17|nr:hypothetical protein ASA1KI_33300 [Opitutales bacterium ASA1]